MKTGSARTLLLALVAVAACGKGGAATTGDAGVHGPTDLVARWTFTGKHASAATCAAHMGQQVYVNLSGTTDPSLHETVTVDCAKGSVDLGKSLLVEDLGLPYLEATLLDDKGMTVTLVGVDVAPVLGTTNVVLDFFPAPMGTGGGTSASSTTAVASSAASSGGMGGAGGAGGAATTSTASTSSTSGGGDAGADGG